MQFECADGKYVALSAAMAAPSVTRGCILGVHDFLDTTIDTRVHC